MAGHDNQAIGAIGSDNNISGGNSVEKYLARLSKYQKTEDKIQGATGGGYIATKHPNSIFA